jgi:O-succinylbenzoic acid--CoA ligase
VGRPLLGTELTVVDGDGRPVEEGETGELVVSGPTVTPGYYDDADATGEAFGTYGLATGDVGRVEDGRVYVLNRLDDRIVTGGENVDPGEVRAAVRAHPDVADVAVVGLPDERWGEVVGALVVPEPGADLSVDAVQASCRDRLAGFKLPRVVAVAESLPRTDSGTVDREAVRDRLREARPERVEIPEAETGGGAGSGDDGDADEAGDSTAGSDGAAGGDDAATTSADWADWDADVGGADDRSGAPGSDGSGGADSGSGDGEAADDRDPSDVPEGIPDAEEDG